MPRIDAYFNQAAQNGLADAFDLVGSNVGENRRCPDRFSSSRNPFMPFALLTVEH
jgi:hypothetical protein